MRQISAEAYQELSERERAEHVINSLIDTVGDNKAVMDEVVKRLTRRPIRYDVTYDGTGIRIKSVVPVYSDV